MKTITPVRGLLFVAALCAAVTSRAQVVELRATLNAAQETPVSTSPATGTAIMLYDIGANTFDLIVNINNMANTATDSHIHEAGVGVAGPPVTPFGGETVYTRTGNMLTATFRDVVHRGDKLTLLRGGAYYNIRSAQFPGGEIRGQLIARPKRLYSVFTVEQEQAAFPNINLLGANLSDFGAAIILYDPAANRVSVRISVFNFRNTFINSHFHQGPVGVDSPVVTGLGNNPNATFANGGSYANVNGFIDGVFDIAYTGDPIRLLTGGNYLNFHSNVFPQGEVRGQIYASNDIPATRFSNISVRGFVGPGEQALIQGFTVNGPEPIRAVITVKGPSLSTFGITGALANPRLALHDSGGRLIAVNDDVGAVAAGSELARIPGIPTNPVESTLVVVLPPGNYTAIVGAATGTGIALLEIADLRNLLGFVTAAATDGSLVRRERTPATRLSPTARVALELCGGLPLATTTIAKR